ncbi:hypothetical protein SPI_05667 [Niveomyces insectorum RCEF 264]|uniref:Uncharacterized protein n=1 Tax=Niveomyces insectorum RCEF 264 TaxID=1081102 RepID=A0A167TFC8_9HYPO|nr:hypothetical protein SPI_05667 [Niveomyces insectorum RCEF 264]
MAPHEPSEGRPPHFTLPWPAELMAMFRNTRAPVGVVVTLTLGTTLLYVTLFHIVWSFFSPDSPYRQDPRLFRPVIALHKLVFRRTLQVTILLLALETVGFCLWWTSRKMWPLRVWRYVWRYDNEDNAAATGYYCFPLVSITVGLFWPVLQSIMPKW